MPSTFSFAVVMPVGATAFFFFHMKYTTTTTTTAIMMRNRTTSPAIRPAWETSAGASVVVVLLVGTESYSKNNVKH